MRYIFVSDIHGCYDKLMTALTEVNFDAEKDTIVSLGDCFDRGNQSYEVLKFLMTCPNRILLYGNHDLRLKKLLLNESVDWCDYSNGVLETMRSFCKLPKLSSIELGITLLKSDSDLHMRHKLLWKYFGECHYAVEWSDLVGTHGWIPYNEDFYTYRKDWRNANADEWYRATWAKTSECFLNELFVPDKTLIVGHWHAFRLRRLTAKIINSEIDFSTFKYEDKLIAIDGCTNADEGVVNTFVYETNEIPTYIK